MGASPSDITFLLVTYNSAHVVANALESLPPESRVICVDNGSRDETCNLLGRYPVELVRNADNVGYGRACNQAAALARSNFLVIMNPDVVLQADAIAHLLRASEAYPDAAVYLPLTEDVRGKPLFRDRTRIEEWNPAIRNRPGAIPSGDCCTRFADGSVFMIRRNVFERLGGFDPEIFLYYEDDDLSLRLVKGGEAIVLVAAARARHLVSQSSAVTTHDVVRRNAARKASEYYMRAKHGWPRARSLDAFGQLFRLAWAALTLNAKETAAACGRLGAVLGLIRGGR